MESWSFLSPRRFTLLSTSEAAKALFEMIVAFW